MGSLYQLQGKRCANSQFAATRHRQSCPSGYECMEGNTCLPRPKASNEFAIAEGDNWSIDCPENSFELSEEQCKKVPDKKTGVSYKETIETNVDPAGCFLHKSHNQVYYNKRDTGNAMDDRMPLCGNYFYEFATDGYCANGYAAPNTIRDSVFGCFDTCRRDAKIDYFAYDFVDKTCSCYDSESCPREAGSSGNYKSFKILSRELSTTITAASTKDCFTYDVDSVGNDIESKSDISSVHECQKLCYRKEDCKYFLFGETSSEGTCWLKTDRVATFTTLSGLVFGPKTCDCFNYNVDSAGHDLEKKVGIPSIHACQELCKGNSDCNYFLFGYTAEEGTCWLKKEKVASFTSYEGLVFGPKVCE